MSMAQAGFSQEPNGLAPSPSAAPKSFHHHHHSLLLQWTFDFFWLCFDSLSAESREEGKLAA